MEHHKARLNIDRLLGNRHRVEHHKARLNIDRPLDKFSKAESRKVLKHRKLLLNISRKVRNPLKTLRKSLK